MKQNIVLSLFEHVHINIKDEILFYNTQNGRYFKELSYKIKDLVKTLMAQSNRALSLSSEIISDPEYSCFINKILEQEMGSIKSEKDYYKNMPDPIEQVISQRRNPKKNKNYLSKLSEVLLYLNGNCNLNCKSCSYAYKQHIACKKSKHDKSLGLETILQCIDTFNNIPIKKLHITGGNPLEYSNLKLVLKILPKTSFHTTIHINYIHFLKNWMELSKNNSKNMTLNILVTQYQPKEINTLTHILLQYFQNYTITFFMESETQFNYIQSLHQTTGLQNIKAKTLFNGHNHDFIKTNIYFGENMIFSKNPGMEKIQQKSRINKNYFGKLIIDNTGESYSNINGASLGNITSTSLQKIIQKELKYCWFWKLTREQVYPCNSCCYQYVCPDISNYEMVLDKFNLCHINPK